MGHAEYVLALTNASSQPCMLEGRPRVQLLDRAGKPLPTHATPAAPGQTTAALALGAGRSAAASALVAVDIPGPGDAQRPGRPCQPAAAYLRVDAAGETSTVVRLHPPTPVCRRGSISLEPFVVQKPAKTIRSGLRAMLERLLRYPPSTYTLSVRFDPMDRRWAEWSYAPAGPADEFQGGVGFAHLAAGTWHNVWGPGNPGFCQLGGPPATVPATVLHAFEVTCSAR